MDSVYIFHDISPLIVTDVSRGEIGAWVTEHFPLVPITFQYQIQKSHPAKVPAVLLIAKYWFQAQLTPTFLKAAW